MQENERKRFSLFILTLSINMEEVTLLEYWYILKNKKCAYYVLCIWRLPPSECLYDR